MQPEPALPRTDEVSDEDRETDAAAEGVEVAVDEAGSDVGMVRSQAPQMPWTIDIHSSITHYTPLPGGGMLLQFTVAMPTPRGIMPLAPAIRLAFSKEGWERFRTEVERGGVKSKIQKATALPATVLPPGVQR